MEDSSLTQLDLSSRSAGISTYSTPAGGLTEDDLINMGISVYQPGESSSLNFEDYLQLMVQQLQNQTMDSTMDSSEMLNQLVQMSTVQMMSAIQESMNTMVGSITLTYSASLVGKTVTVGQYDKEGNLQEIVGTVTGTGTYQGSPVIFLGEDMYQLSDIMAIGVLPEKETDGSDNTESGTGNDGVTDNGDTADSSDTADKVSAEG